MYTPGQKEVVKRDWLLSPVTGEQENRWRCIRSTAVFSVEEEAHKSIDGRSQPWFVFPTKTSHALSVRHMSIDCLLVEVAALVG